MKKLLIVLCALACLLTGCAAPKEDAEPNAAPTSAAVETDAPEASEAPETTEAPEATADATQTAVAEPAAAYLVVTVADAIYEPIPLRGPGRYTVSRANGAYVNVIEVTETSICMAQSSCDNQDCVYQGTVDLSNKDERVLQNMIICLPNNVMLELYTYEELQQALPGWTEAQ